MVEMIYMVLGMKCISAYEKIDIFGVREVITILSHLISNISYFVKKKYCKILGWLIYALYEKEIILVHLGFYRLRMDESELDLERVKGEPFLLAFPFCRRQIISWMCWATSSTATEKSKVIKYTKIHLLGEFFVKLNLVNLTMFITNLHCQHHEVL